MTTRQEPSVTGARVRPRTTVLVVASTPAVATHLVAGLRAEADISIVGESAAIDDAASMVEHVRPDVLVLDLAATGAGPQEAIRQIMGHTPTPILVMAPPGTDSRSGYVVDALRAGAVEAIETPATWTEAFATDLRRRVRILRGVTVLRHPGCRQAPAPPLVQTPAPAGRSSRIVAIAASTGGPAALAEIVAGLQGVAAPVLVVQHMHVDFVEGLVVWLSRVASIPVRLAVDGARLEAGVVYVGPGDVHLKVGAGRRVVLDPAPLTPHRPSADQLFFSMAEHVGPDGIGVVLTGMGSDGAAGLLAMRQNGGATVAQDQATSVVFGMPRAAAAAGAAVQILPLADIAAAVVRASLGAQL